MEHDRIKKLLSSEYRDFADTIIVESPFAETTRDGRGLRQVSLGLTPSRLVIAADVMKKNTEFTCPPDLDPSIESFELVTIYPLELIALSIFRRRKRRTLKARLIDGRAKYYELGGMERRGVFWSLWCDGIREILSRKRDGSSLSETTAASSSSASTFYLLSSGVELKDNDLRAESTGARGVRARYGGAGDGQVAPWPRKDVYLGPSYDELSHGYYTPVPVRFAGASLEEISSELRDATPKGLACKKTCGSWPCARNGKKSVNSETIKRGGGMCDVLFTRERKKRGNRRETNDQRRSLDDDSLVMAKNDRSRVSRLYSPSLGEGRMTMRRKHELASARKRDDSLAPKLSRFGFGIGENCRSGLYLEPWSGDQEHYRRAKIFEPRRDIRQFIDDGVRLWERENGKTRVNGRRKHRRRYAIATAAHFFHALGPWSVQPGERESVQRRRASSAVCIRRQPIEPELRLPVSKRQLAASVSLTCLEPGRHGTSMSSSSSSRGRVVLFWTPEYWYRPRAATAAYKELRKHLCLLRDFRSDKERGGIAFFGRKWKNNNVEGDRGETTRLRVTGERSASILTRIFSSRDARRKTDERKERGESGTGQLRRLLRMDLRITAWDLDSTTIAEQLTLIDRELFQRIPCSEMDVLTVQRSSRNTPNLGAWIAFSHRVSCLTASEILATKKLDMRSRIISRFVNAADKCWAMGNFHSCRSILAGLESPSVYRLESTWSHLRIYHSTRYETMERLCRIYRNTTTIDYRRAWKKCEKSPPSLPYVGHLLARIIRDDDEPDERVSPSGKWENLPCRISNDSSRFNEARVSSIVGNACRAISSESAAEKSTRKRHCCGDNGEGRESDGLVKRRGNIGGRIVTAAMTKIAYFASRSSTEVKKNSEICLSARQRVLSRKFYFRWRRYVLTSRIIAENRAKYREMEPRKRRILNTSAWLCERQRHSQAYHFSGHSLAWEFLLKARYREDRENFFISLKLEPPCG